MRWLINFVKSVLGICETKPLNPNLWSFEDNQVRVKLSDMPELCEMGKGTYIKGRGLPSAILIVRTQDDQYLAYTDRCTHLGHRKLDPVLGTAPGEPILRCSSLSHSTFDCQGNRITGPAKDPLVRHEVELKDGELVITLAAPSAEEAVPETAAEEPPAEAATTEEAAVQAEPGEGAVEEAETAKEA